MKKIKGASRRSFVKKLGASSALLTGITSAMAFENQKPHILKAPSYDRKKVSANDKIRLACVGTGGMGMGDTDTALMIEGVEVVAACDLYDSRLVRAKDHKQE